MRWLLPLFLLACSGSDTKSDADVDTDADTDTDTDADTDADTDSDTDADATQVQFDTTMGSFVIELYETEAPVTTANFLEYVDSGFYDGDDGLDPTIFHRIIEDFVVQGGGVTASGARKDTNDPIVNESDNGLSNLRGTVAMARTSDPNSATSQFYVNLVDNTFLDIDGSYPPGYAVFGEVVSGMDIIDAMAVVATDGSDRPTTDIVVTDCERVQ